MITSHKQQTELRSDRNGRNFILYCRPKAARKYLQFVRTSLYSNMAERGCDQVTIWKTTEPGDMNTFGVTGRYLDFNHRGPDWDQNNLNIYRDLASSFVCDPFAL